LNALIYGRRVKWDEVMTINNEYTETSIEKIPPDKFKFQK